MFKKLTVIVAVSMLLLCTLSVMAMSPRDAFEEARKFHKGDPNFVENYNIEQDHHQTHPGLMGGRFGHIEPPVYDTRNMPHAPGGDFPLF